MLTEERCENTRLIFGHNKSKYYDQTGRYEGVQLFMCTRRATISAHTHNFDKLGKRVISLN